jgi:hypothetical protein
MNVPIPPGPPFFRFSDPEESKRALIAAGFSDPVIGHVKQVWRLPSSNALFEIFFNASVRNAALLRAQKAEVLAAIRNEIQQSVEKYRNDLPMSSVLASALR